MTPDEVKEVYDYDVKAKGYTTYGTEEPEIVRRSRTVVGDEKSGEGKVCVWRVFCKRSGHEFTIGDGCKDNLRRTEEHTSEFQSLMRSSYADFCLHKKIRRN